MRKVLDLVVTIVLSCVLIEMLIMFSWYIWEVILC